MSEQSGTPKGANLPRKRNALGRGLSALMSAAAVSVDSANKPGIAPGAAKPNLHKPSTPFVPSAQGNTVPSPSAAPTPGSAPTLEVLEGRLNSEKSEKPSSSVLEPQEAHAATDNALEGGLTYVSIDRVFPNKGQPRQHFIQSEIDSLSESIRKTGLLQPILVRRRAGDRGQLATYEIVAGERRWRAAKQAGLVKIPALLRQITDRESLEIGIVENIHRSDLNPIEEALAYQRLADEFGASQNEIAEKVGKDRASIANGLRLLKLAPQVQEMVVRGQLSAGHGKALLMAPDHSSQCDLAKRIVAEGLSVRAAEQIAGAGRPADEKSSRTTPKKAAEKVAASTIALEERFRRALGTKVKLSLDKAGTGELTISFFSSAELEQLIERLGA